MSRAEKAMEKTKLGWQGEKVLGILFKWRGAEIPN